MKAGLGNIMKQAQQMQENLKKVQDEIARTEVEGESGAGMVKVVMTGKHDVKKIKIEWGFGHEYQNYIKLKSKKLELYIPFFFSKPEKFIPKVFINNSEEISFRNIDQFRKLYSLALNDHKNSALYNSYNSIYNRYYLMKRLLDD